MLDNTTLAPNYTIFGKVKDEDIAILDKITQEVNPVGTSGDARPNKEITIVEVKLED